MRRILFSIFLLNLFCLPVLATEAPVASSEKAEVKQEVKSLSSKEISTGMAEVWCQKMAQCAQGSAMGIQECRKVLYKSFKQGFDNVPKDSKLNVSSETYGECVKNIQGGTCESLKVAQTLSGCEFISLLHR